MVVAAWRRSARCSAVHGVAPPGTVPAFDWAVKNASTASWMRLPISSALICTSSSGDSTGSIHSILAMKYPCGQRVHASSAVGETAARCVGSGTS